MTLEEDFLERQREFNIKYDAQSDPFRWEFIRRVDRMRFLKKLIADYYVQKDALKKLLLILQRKNTQAAFFLFFVAVALNIWTKHSTTSTSQMNFFALLFFCLPVLVWLIWHVVELPRLESNIANAEGELNRAKYEWSSLVGYDLKNEDLVAFSWDICGYWPNENSEDEWEAMYINSQDLEIKTQELLFAKLIGIEK